MLQLTSAIDSQALISTRSSLETVAMHGSVMCAYLTQADHPNEVCRYIRVSADILPFLTVYIAANALGNRASMTKLMTG